MSHHAFDFPSRRHFLRTALAAATAPTLGSLHAAAPRQKHILLRSSWQTVNIGDIAHTPGMLALLEKYLPDFKVSLWPSNVNNGVDAMLKKRFPKVDIVKPGKDATFEEYDFLLHGSGPGLVAEKSLVQWHNATNKPYGVGGITFAGGEKSIAVLSGAAFVFFRDSVSLQYAKDKGCTSPIMAFGPDATFACDLTNDQAAAAWLTEAGLEEGQFICCIPKLRHTPYWEIKNGVPFSETRHKRNEEMKEHDIGPLRNAVIAVVKETGKQVLLCPEDASQMKLNKEMIYDKLPEDVKKHVVWRKDYWLTDFAQSVYNRSLGLFGNEQHSPIMCIGHGIPAIVCRYKEQTSKGFMWRDIGLSEWLLDHDKDEPANNLTQTVLDIVNDQESARTKARKAKEIADARMKNMMDTLRSSLV